MRRPREEPGRGLGTVVDGFGKSARICLEGKQKACILHVQAAWVAEKGALA